MVPFKSFKGVTVTAKGLMTGIQILCKKMFPLMSLLNCLEIFKQKIFRKVLTMATFRLKALCIDFPITGTVTLVNSS